MKRIRSFHLSLFTTSLLVTFFATSGFIFYSAYSSYIPPEESSAGEKLGITTSSSTYNLLTTDEARNAFLKFCSINSSDCTLDMFCHKFPQYCSLRVETQKESTDSTSTSTTLDSEVKIPTPTLTPSPIISQNSTHPTATPTPTPLPRLVDLSYCYDSDGNDAAANGVCRDQSGVYYDSCSSGVVSEYICREKKCTVLKSQCKLGTSCLVNRCVDIPVTEVPTPTAVPRTDAQPTQHVATATRTPTRYVQPTEQAQREPYKNITAPVQELSASLITAPSNGSQVSGLVQIHTSISANSNTTLLLQPIKNSSNRISLGKVTEDGTASWDTTLLPNGDYNLYAVTHGLIRKAVSEPVSVAISNSRSQAPTHTVMLASEFKPEQVTVKKTITIQKIEKPQQDRGVGLEFTGRAEPNQLVTILIYSNPIVVTVRADVNGVWTYTLDEPLEPGNHEAYVVVPSEDGTQVRSELSTFFVPQVYASSSDNQILQRASAQKSPMIFNFILLSVILVLDAIVVLLIVYRFRSNRTRHV